MKIAVIGTGYVGLVTGTCLAETGNTVTCVDIDEQKINKLKNGIVPIYEPHLDNFFQRNISQRRLFFTTSLEKGIADAQLIFLALPTPPGEDGSADLSYILTVAEQLGELITEYKVIIDKSTVPVGTADKVKHAINKKAKVAFDVVSNPEFLREGYAVEDFMKPDRVVVGCSSDKAKNLMEELYKPFVRQGNPILFMDEKSAELTKYAANSFLATKITFMNEIANYCEIIGADVDKVRKGIGTDTRIGKRFLFPGIGYGGSCFPKDVKALKKSGMDENYQFKIIDSVMEVNDRQKTKIVDKIVSFYGNDLSDKTFALWGLAFKPETDDIREAPSLEIIDKLVSLGAQIVAYDPEAMKNVEELIGNKIKYASSSLEAVQESDALIIATEWAAFRNPDFDVLMSSMKSPVIFDGRNLYSIESMEKRNFYYQSMGRKIVNNLRK
ncbi:MAG: UDP-glucose/GDP-mannose dehydrogenase family protein [Flavobacteriales bacterium]|nr:UDP-glucose/GDP-mannose dehydrogenase family protein [Flavobacteriales bacterium]